MRRSARNHDHTFFVRGNTGRVSPARHTSLLSFGASIARPTARPRLKHMLAQTLMLCDPHETCPAWRAIPPCHLRLPTSSFSCLTFSL